MSMMTYNALVAHLGPTLTAALTGGQGIVDDDRMKFALRIFRKISKSEDENDLARAWMIGGNPMLGDDTPITAIREGRFGEVEAAAANHLER